MIKRSRDDETRHILLRRMADNPALSQRELAKVAFVPHPFSIRRLGLRF